MDDSTFSNVPAIFPQILAKCKEIAFTMPSDMQIGPLLQSLIASKLNSNILELGTGIGLSLAWMIEGLDTNSKITSIDNDPTLSSIAKDFFGSDQPRSNYLYGWFGISHKL